MANLKQKLLGSVVISLAFIVLVYMVIMTQNTPEHQVINWLNSLPEFTSSPGGMLNTNVVERNTFLHRALRPKQMEFDEEGWTIIPKKAGLYKQACLCHQLELLTQLI